jgi:uncharacterized protein (TIGR02453 family)
MSCKYPGIKPESIFLLAENRFNDSKSFYDAHKEELKNGIILPLRALVEDLTPTLSAINPDIILDPSRIICRIRRDTRFTNDKSLYRENLWIMLRHQKNELPTPTFWFEFFPDRYSYGVGLLSETPAFMQFWRREIVGQKSKLLRAAKSAENAGFRLDCDSYKRSKSDADGVTGALKRWYDLKNIYLVRTVPGIAGLNQPRELVDELCAAYKAAAPMYKFLLKLSERFNNGEI